MTTGSMNRTADGDTRAGASPDARHDPEFENLLACLRYSRGFDFSGYKRAGLMRRGDYVNHLEAHPDELRRLFNTILINATAFFRDAPTWDYLAAEVLRRIKIYATDVDEEALAPRACLAGRGARSELTVSARNRHGKALSCRVRLTRPAAEGTVLGSAVLESATRG